MYIYLKTKLYQSAYNTGIKMLKIETNGRVCYVLDIYYYIRNSTSMINVILVEFVYITYI